MNNLRPVSAERVEFRLTSRRGKLSLGLGVDLGVHDIRMRFRGPLEIPSSVRRLFLSYWTALVLPRNDDRYASLLRYGGTD